MCDLREGSTTNYGYLVWAPSESEYEGFGYDDGGQFCCTFSAGSVNKGTLIGTANTDNLYFNWGAIYLENGKGTGTMVGEMKGGDDDDNLTGSECTDLDYSDDLYGEGGNDILDGGSGKDRLWGGGNNDTMYGGSEDDEMHGGLGMDYLDGESGDDTMHGGGDADKMAGGTDVDIMYGDDGDDDICAESGTYETLYGNGGADTLYAADYEDTNRCGGDTGDASDNTGDTLGCPDTGVSGCPFTP